MDGKKIMCAKILPTLSQKKGEKEKCLINDSADCRAVFEKLSNTQAAIVRCAFLSAESEDKSPFICDKKGYIP